MRMCESLEAKKTWRFVSFDSQLMDFRRRELRQSAFHCTAARPILFDSCRALKCIKRAYFYLNNNNYHNNPFDLRN